MPYEGVARSSLFSRKQVGGVFVVDDAMRHPGNVWFVDSGNTTHGADAVGYGRNPDRPFLTIDYAVGQCTASNGDVIYVLPGHAETVSAAAGLALDVIGISVIGVGNGTLQPTITFDTDANSDMDVDAASITVENIHFVANFADIAAMIDVNATDFTLRNCRFSQAAANMNALICVQDAAAAASDRITIEGCTAIMYDASNTHFVNFAGTGTGHIVRNNILMGDWGTMCIGGAGLTTYTTIIDNVIYNAAADNDSCINSAATSGICMRNLIGGGAAQANGVTAAGLALAENYYGVAAEDLSAILEPVAT
jgi:hypothetical protein